MRMLNKTERMALAVVTVFTVIAGICRYTDVPAVPAFAAATVALAGLAYVVSFATEHVGESFGPAVTGVLQSTLGNLPELFIVIFALKSGQVVVAQTSIIGSIFANALLVLGIVIIVGARRGGGVMTFQKRLPNDTATLLLVAVFIIVIVGLSIASHDEASGHIQGISNIASIALLCVYVSWVTGYLRADKRPGAKHPPRVPLAVSIVLLAIAGVGSAFVSDWFIHALEPAIKELGVSEAFAGLVIVAIAGNAVENATGVIMAWKGQSDLAISIVKNSVAQIAAFLFPLLILISLLFASHLTYALEPVYIGALALTAISVWQVSGDGEANEFEGWALIAIYVVLAAVTLYE
jgi:Ca2+:H+ antiporter